MFAEEREIEEEEAIDHLSHEHPLILVETRLGDYCHGCRMYFSGEEHAYGCSKKCGYTRLLHEECAALPRRITHAMHPQHILIQQRFQHLLRCAICESYIWSIGYGCESGECEFQMHIRCEQGSSVMGTADDDVAVVAMKHVSHPEHELRLREDSLWCDACGTTRIGMSYICNAVCPYWIHHTCATLPQTMEREDHHHSLSLSYYVPPQYIKFGCKCGVCNQYLLGKYWIYHCELCKYGVHVKCAFKESPRQATMSGESQSVYHWSHKHLLTLVVSSKAVRCLICRGSIKKGERAYGCAERCAYPQLLHEECAGTPRRISHPMHPQHELTLKYIEGFQLCAICTRRMPYEGYKCEGAECEFQMHLRCALDSNAMDNDKRPPAVIQHPSHPHHDLRLWRRWSSKCDACAAPPRGRSYICTVCEYRVHERCASLPAMERGDHHHILSLSFCVPLEYIKFHYKCDVCDKDLLARFWIYNCMLCRYAVHLKCAFKMMPRTTVRNADDEEEEKTIVSHFHDHPLTLAETRRGGECHDCERLVTSGGLAYVCSKKCGYQGLLHEECGEMTIKIRHPSHPQHILARGYASHCAICRKQETHIGYHCRSLGCEFQIHTRCMLDNNDELGRATLHRSHPQHELRLLQRICSFRCDACGIKHTGKSYICTSCEYWVHHSCASLPETFKREDHDHSLSLSFCVPLEYIEFDFKCEVCRKDLLGRFWIYHCRLCRYAVHISCIFKKPAARITDDDEYGVIRFPVDNVAEEQIRPFVMMKGEAIAPIPDYAIHEFYKDKHEMRLVSSCHGDQNKEENSDNEDDYGQISKLMCDGCATPIHQKQSSSSKSKYYYMSCSEGKYFLHLECFLLQPRLSSIPLHNQPDHELVLQTSAKLELDKDCSFCKLPMNGLFYSCTVCDFKADIKCATVPDTMLHAAHPHILKLTASSKKFQSLRSCAALCDASRLDSDDYWYICGSCKEEEEFCVHVSCATLPRSIWSLKWDKQHALPLTFDANLNHPGEFYCDECEEQMNPKRWMYHCRDCDLSFHPHCFKATPGEYRNIKFGGRVNAVAHPQHPLTYQLLTAKRRCNVCGEDRYEKHGFHCAFCNFFICCSPDCGAKMIRDGDIRVAD